jgi:hypothetical protein
MLRHKCPHRRNTQYTLRNKAISRRHTQEDKNNTEFYIQSKKNLNKFKFKIWIMKNLKIRKILATSWRSHVNVMSSTNMHPYYQSLITRDVLVFNETAWRWSRMWTETRNNYQIEPAWAVRLVYFYCFVDGRIPPIMIHNRMQTMKVTHWWPPAILHRVNLEKKKKKRHFVYSWWQWHSSVELRYAQCR